MGALAMSIWGRYKDGEPERIDSGDSAYLLAEYRLAFGRDWLLWRGTRRDEPKEATT
jgi:hypothetical protein